MSCSSRKKIDSIFCIVQFVRRKFCNICDLSQSVLNTLLKYTYFYISKNITSYTFLLVFKIIESLQYILKIQSLFNYIDKVQHHGCVIYCSVCLWGADYIGETIRNSEIRWKEHSTGRDKNSDCVNNYIISSIMSFNGMFCPVHRKIV